MTASVTRVYRFSASHRLHTGSLSESENARIFGKCNNPYGHGHNYELEVTLHGPIDPQTGLVVPLAELDRYVEDQVLRRFSNKNINEDVAPFATLIPTTENLTTVIADLLRAGWPFTAGSSPITLRRVHVQETPRNGFEFILERQQAPDLKPAAATSLFKP
jgi:6-pyruvoyltetrahydropterin/6-carboxytetrahydropterin synthase